MNGPLEVDWRGKRNNPNDPIYYFIMDRFGNEICDTMNCRHLFDEEEQRQMMKDLADTWNRSMEKSQ